MSGGAVSTKGADAVTDSLLEVVITGVEGEGVASTTWRDAFGFAKRSRFLQAVHRSRAISIVPILVKYPQQGLRRNFAFSDAGGTSADFS
jgi:hypothetical protein